jgi:hypothetical protein
VGAVVVWTRRSSLLPDDDRGRDTGCEGGTARTGGGVGGPARVDTQGDASVVVAGGGQPRRASSGAASSSTDQGCGLVVNPPAATALRELREQVYAVTSMGCRLPCIEFPRAFFSDYARERKANVQWRFCRPAALSSAAVRLGAPATSRSYSEPNSAWESFSMTAVGPAVYGDWPDHRLRHPSGPHMMSRN